MPQPHEKFWHRLSRQARQDPIHFSISLAASVLSFAVYVCAAVLSCTALVKHCSGG